MIGLPPSLALGAIASRAGQAAPWGLAVWHCSRRTQCHAPLQPRHHSHDELPQWPWKHAFREASGPDHRGDSGSRGATPLTAHGGLGDLYLVQGDLEPAIQVLEPGLALCRASGNRIWLPSIGAGLGYAYALRGHLAEEHTLLEEASSEDIRTGALRDHARWVAWRSEVCRLAGRGAEAWQHARQALDLARQQQARGEEGFALHQLGVVQAHADPPDVAQAEAHYHQALALAEELGMRPLTDTPPPQPRHLYATTGQREQARVALSMAIEMYQSMEMTFWLPETEAALAQVDA